MMRKALAAAVSAVMLLTAPMPVHSEESDVFFDDFASDFLDTEKWLIAQKNWGGTVTENGVTSDYNGGVIPENVNIRNGELVLTGLGNLYEGELCGINRDGSVRSDGKRCGGAIATKDYFASGSYEIRAKIAPVLGCCSAMWTFEYEEDYSGDSLKITNHEIDIEFPGRDENNTFSLSHSLCTTWVTEEDYVTKSAFCGDQADGNYHTYRFDWHTGSDSEEPRVEYYFDNVLTYTSYDYIPTNESRFWLGMWFPKNWAGTPDFEKEDFMIDYVKITPFHESGDTPQNESYPEHGWAKQQAELPKGWLLWHSYSSYSAMDSRLFLRDPNGSIAEIKGNFIHPMNGSFGTVPGTFTFMAIDQAADEWDIFLYNGGKISNLTENSGSRNEDPKFSPDGRSIVFKRGKWDNSLDDFSYDLALLDLSTNEVTMLTDNDSEEAMPCFSSDGKSVFYTSYKDHIGSICRLDLASGKTDTLFSQEGVNAYYPIVSGNSLFFTKWLSADNHCDQIMRIDGSDATPMPFDSANYDCSDACPTSANGMVYSSTCDGAYDLYYFDGNNSTRLTSICSENNDLGAAFYSLADYREFLEKHGSTGDVNGDGAFNTADAVSLEKWLLGVPGAELAYADEADLCHDGKLNAFDMTAMRQALAR